MASSSSLDSETSLQSKALVIGDNLYRYCVAPDDGKRLRETGSICPGSSLKQSHTKKAFEWVHQINCMCSRRYFTTAACQLGIKRLLEKPNLQIPQTIGLPFELWLVQQAKLVQHLCYRARKTVGSASRFRRYRQSRTMDWAETIPMEVNDDGQDIVTEETRRPMMDESNVDMHPATSKVSAEEKAAEAKAEVERILASCDTLLYPPYDEELGIRWNDEIGGFEKIPEPEPPAKGYWLRRKGRNVWIQPGGSHCCFDKKNGRFYCPHGPDCAYCLEIQNRPLEEELFLTLSLGSPWASTSSDCWEDGDGNALSGGDFDQNLMSYLWEMATEEGWPSDFDQDLVSSLWETAMDDWSSDVDWNDPALWESYVSEGYWQSDPSCPDEVSPITHDATSKELATVASLPDQAATAVPEHAAGPDPHSQLLLHEGSVTYWSAWGEDTWNTGTDDEKENNCPNNAGDDGSFPVDHDAHRSEKPAADHAHDIPYSDAAEALQDDGWWQFLTDYDWSGFPESWWEEVDEVHPKSSGKTPDDYDKEFEKDLGRISETLKDGDGAFKTLQNDKLGDEALPRDNKDKCTERSSEGPAPFELDLRAVAPGSTSPPEVLTRVSGKQTPSAPHKQRLLVAAAKAAKAAKADKADKANPKDANAARPKAKSKSDKAKEKGKSKTTSETPVPDEDVLDDDGDAPPPPPKQKTEYALAKGKYMAMLKSEGVPLKERESRWKASKERAEHVDALPLYEQKRRRFT